MEVCRRIVPYTTSSITPRHLLVGVDIIKNVALRNGKSVPLEEL